MSELKVATRYAKSLLDLAKERGILQQVEGDMQLLQQTLKANAILQAVLRNPIIPQDKKLTILDALFASKVHLVTIAFFKLLIQKGRGSVLEAISRSFLDQYKLHKNIVDASLVVAMPCAPAVQKEIIDLLEQATNKHIVLETSINKNLLGGFILRVGDKQLDASIAGKIHRLRRTLLKD